MLDKLVAVQIDLRTVRGAAMEKAQVIALRESIAEACDVLSSAIADLRNVIHQVDNLTDRRETETASDDRGRAPSPTN